MENSSKKMGKLISASTDAQLASMTPRTRGEAWEDVGQAWRDRLVTAWHEQPINVLCMVVAVGIAIAGATYGLGLVVPTIDPGFH